MVVVRVATRYVGMANDAANDIEYRKLLWDASRKEIVRFHVSFVEVPRLETTALNWRAHVARLIAGEVQIIATKVAWEKSKMIFSMWRKDVVRRTAKD